jgi:hypothetical protein
MSFLALLRAYTLREYAAVLAMALLGALGLVFMLNSMGGGSSTGETLLKRETTVRKETASLRFAESNAAARARARTVAARRAKIRAERRMIAVRAARRAAAAARRTPAPKRTVVRTTPQAIAPVPTRVVNTTPSRPAPRPQPAPAPKPTPQKSGVTGGGGGGSFDDSG